jgi:hypothetical protein
MDLPKGEAKSNTRYDLFTEIAHGESVTPAFLKIKNRTDFRDLVAVLCVDFGFNGLDWFLPLLARLNRDRVLETSN